MLPNLYVKFSTLTIYLERNTSIYENTFIES